MFIIIETIVNIKHEEQTCFKGHRCFSKNLFMSIRHEKINSRFPLLLFLCTEQFTDTNMFTFLHTGQLFFWKCKMYIYYLLLHLFPSLCSHTVFWWSYILNKTVFIGIFYCFCCQTTEWIWNSDWNTTH